MLLAPFFVLTFLLAIGVLIFLVTWTIRRARQGGRSAMVTTVGVWALAGLLTTFAVTAWVMTNWRSPVSASPRQLAGLWASDSPEGRATIELRPDGSAVVDGVPPEAAWTGDAWDEASDRPAVLSGEGVWQGEPFEEIEFTCADGQTLRMHWQTVESPTGVMYLQFIAGDPDDPVYFGEFSKVDHDELPRSRSTASVGC